VLKIVIALGSSSNLFGPQFFKTGNYAAGDRLLGWPGLFACPTTYNIVTMARGAPIKPNSYIRMSAARTPFPARS
jgi:hypothetical protein